MNHIADKALCCGCQACGDICPKGAISFPVDNEGFWYPHIDAGACIDCGLCKKVCPVLNIEQIKSFGQKEPLVYGGFHKNIAIRFDSTSGGAFSALAQAFYKTGGYVSGAIQNADWSVTNFISNKKRDLSRLRSSKYVQSSATGLYKTIKQLLEQGERVLACGSPCQMGALRSFLGKDYENLLIVDFICRATNSPKVYAKYLEWLEAVHGAKVVSIKAKNKEHGWRSLARKITFENGDVYYGETKKDHYRRGYHGNYYQRPSCYACKFKGFPRCADITLGDFWGIEKVDSSLDHNLGTSCILLNTEKGIRFFESVKESMEIKAFTLEEVLAGNRGPLMTQVKYPQGCDRAALFADLDRMPFDELANKYFPLNNGSRPSMPAPSHFARVRSLIGKVKRGMGYALQSLLHPKEYYRKFKWSFPQENINADFRKGRFFDVLDYCSIDLRLNSLITMEAGHFIFGRKRNLASRQESRLLLDKGAKLHILGSGKIAAGADIQVFKNGSLTIGKNFACNSGFQLVCAESITIGDDVHIGRDVWIRDNNGEHYIIQPGYTWKAPVTIGNHCWLCTRVCVMKGVTIGEGTVVSANSVVTHSLPPHCIASGNPAEVIAEDVIWRE